MQGQAGQAGPPQRDAEGGAGRGHQANDTKSALVRVLIFQRHSLAFARLHSAPLCPMPPLYAALHLRDSSLKLALSSTPDTPAAYTSVSDLVISLSTSSFVFLHLVTHKLRFSQCVRAEAVLSRREGHALPHYQENYIANHIVLRMADMMTVGHRVQIRPRWAYPQRAKMDRCGHATVSIPKDIWYDCGHK